MASGTAKAAIQQTKSDAPWAVSSLVVFGGMFIYLTSPPKGGKNAHGHEGGHGGKSDSSSEEPDSEGESDATEEENTDYDNVKKIEDKPEGTGPKGGQVRNGISVLSRSPMLNHPLAPPLTGSG
jgi:hypothetical protein